MAEGAGCRGQGAGARGRVLGAGCGLQGAGRTGVGCEYTRGIRTWQSGFGCMGLSARRWWASTAAADDWAPHG